MANADAPEPNERYTDPAPGDPDVERFWASPLCASMLPTESERNEVRFDTKSIHMRLVDCWHPLTRAYDDYVTERDCIDNGCFVFDADLSKSYRDNKDAMHEQLVRLQPQHVQDLMRNQRWDHWRTFILPRVLLTAMTTV